MANKVQRWTTKECEDYDKFILVNIEGNIMIIGKPRRLYEQEQKE
jgi:hypothetical protein